jgi:hypothetical protein
LIEPNEFGYYEKILRSLKKSHLPNFPVDALYWKPVQKRVHIAQKIAKLQLDNQRINSKNAWIIRAAKEMDIDIDSDSEL